VSDHEHRPILFASHSHHGLFAPLAAIASELDRRGVEGLWFGCTEDRKADVEALSPRGRIGFVPVGRYVPELQPANWSEETFRQLNSKSRVRGFATFMDQTLVGPYAAEFYQQSLNAIDQVKPALIVADVGTTWMFDAAMTRGVPFVINSPTMVSYLYPKPLGWGFPALFSGLPVRMSLRQKLTNLLFTVGRIGVFLHPRRVKASLAFVREREELGISNKMGMLQVYADKAAAIIGHSLFGIEYRFPGAPAHLEMVGPVMPPESDTAPDPAIMSWIDDHESVVYLGFGGMNRPTRAQIDALLETARRLGDAHHLLWSLPKSQHHLLPADVPPNVRIETWVPQVDVLAHPHVRVFMTHGGNGTHHGLYHGKPVLLMPHTWEARDGAVRFADSGAGLLLHDTRTPAPAEIEWKLRRLLADGPLREKALHWQRELRAAGGVKAAADIVLRHR
jgi:polyene glycosyltransferase